MKIKPLQLFVRNLYGTPRYFPECNISRAICKVRGRKTLLLEDINVLNAVGFPFEIYDEKGDKTEL